MGNRSESAIRSSLLQIGAIKEDTISVLQLGTRDIVDLPVFVDNDSGVIFIDDYYAGDSEYIKGQYRLEPKPLTNEASREFEDQADTERRLGKYKQFVVDKYLVDYGCGAGSFLRAAKQLARKVVGIELQQNFRDSLVSDGINCYSEVLKLESGIDTIFMFHSFEHLPQPLSVLADLKPSLRTEGKGRIIIEVPHARDFLIHTLASEPFIKFTLWSKHLILHTRESLYLMLKYAGFKNIIIEGVQRYSIANHIQWLNKGMPGGHKSNLSMLESPTLAEAYSNALSRIDGNDTLVAHATT